jgi:tRNA pseudouridine55 synthase
MQEHEEVVGFVLVDKPQGVTSNSCVQKIRSLIGRQARVGHSGTLDAFATGLLVIGIGRTATKQLASIMALDKTYQACACLGQCTDTFDITGRTIKQGSCSIASEHMEKAIASLGEGYTQVPPVYSALKYQGKALSYYARNCHIDENTLVAITRERSRYVRIYSCELVNFQEPFFSIRARVSHGTYIRSLMNDLAEKCGTCATTHELRRTSIGPFEVEKSLPLEAFDSVCAVRTNLISLDKVAAWLADYTAEVEIF